MPEKRVIILHNEISANAKKDELDVMTQVKVVAESLTELGFKPLNVPFSFDINNVFKKFKKINPLFVFNLVETVNNDGRFSYIAPLIIEYLNLKFSGAGSETMFITSNKVLTKKILKLSNINTAEWFELTDSKEKKNFIPEKYIVKPVWEDASLGINSSSVKKIKDKKQLYDFLIYQCNKLNKECFAERYIEGREFNISILGGNDEPEVLPPAEIKFVGYPKTKLKIVDYNAKWNAESFEYINTPRTFEFFDNDYPLIDKLKKLTIVCWNVFKLRGYARVDFRVDKNNKPYILEINANPCISPDSGFYAAANKRGLRFTEVITQILSGSNIHI